MARTYACLLVLCALLALSCFAAAKEDRFERLRRLAQEKPVIEFDGSKYREFIDVSSRNYSVVLHVTASHPKYQCNVCPEQLRTFELFADSYGRQFGDFQTESFVSRPVFLVKMEPDNAMDIFQQLQITTVPHTIFIKAGKTKPTINQDLYMRNERSPQGYAHFVAQHTGHLIEIYRSPLDKHSHVFVYLAAFVAALAMLRSLIKYRRDPWLWFFVSVCTYLVTMAGTVYNFIHNPPLFDVHPHTHQYVLIMGQARAQYVVEGLIAATLLFATGMVFAAFSYAVNRARSKGHQRMIFFCVMAAFVLCLNMLDRIYRAKYHRSAFEVPRDVLQFVKLA